MPEPIITALAIGSAAASAYASYKKSQSDRQAALNKQAIINAEKAELAKRSAYNQILLRRKLTSNMEGFLGGLSQNVVIDEGKRQSMMQDIENSVAQAKEEADYMIATRGMESEAAGSQAAAINRLTPITAASGGLSAYNSIYSIYGTK